MPTDVTNRADIHHMVQSTLDRWGRIDVLLNDAGISYDEPLVDLEPDKIRNEVQVNLIALIECTQAVLPVMLRQKSGHIINVASIEGLIATPGSSVYCATKFGVFGFSDSLRRQLRGPAPMCQPSAPAIRPPRSLLALRPLLKADPMRLTIPA